ncbi:unnamed protein product [Strongylus vulgaris]|uniref:Uncharacterized protein n=1 Tax=Strongylus vulgaris TaxID=40348 RepID=A0A3P7KKA7_STRVU|nr:unnamed protein product [Strongylus vulgaris]
MLFHTHLTDLYDNALRVIRQRRSRWKKERKRKSLRRSQQLPSSSSSSPSSPNTRLPPAKHDDDVAQSETFMQDIFAQMQNKMSENSTCSSEKPFVYLIKDQSSRITIENVEFEDADETGNDFEDDENAEQEKQSIATQTFKGKEVTINDLANAILKNMEKGACEKEGFCIKFKKDDVVNAIKQVQQYISEELNLGPAEFVSIRLRPTTSSAHLVFNALDKQADSAHNARKVRLKGTLEIHPTDEKTVASSERKNSGILTYDGKEVTVEVVVKAIARLILKIYGKRPPFKISRKELTVFIARKKTKLQRILNLEPLNDEMEIVSKRKSCRKTTVGIPSSEETKYGTYAS